jgi:2-amino-4-hydroxy-6-hydroxymethyldihydropteridine diphosphokinase
MNNVYLLTGSNQGDRLSNLHRVKNLIEKRVGNLIHVSGIYETEPWGYASAKSYYNQCFFLNSTLEPENILREILGIEREMGRKRTGKSYNDRIIDIDILFFNNEIIKTKELTVPHPRLHERRFVLVPLAEIAGDFIHPEFEISIREILESCDDKLIVNQLDLK